MLFRSEIPGTPSYLAPEMFTGNRGDQQTDLFALGVTLWRLFAGRYPYGEIEPFTRPRFRKPDMPSVLRTQLPAWLDAVLMRSVSIEPEERYGDAIELLRALEGGAAVARVKQNFVPLIERNPARFWQMVSLMLLAALIAALATR